VRKAAVETLGKLEPAALAQHGAALVARLEHSEWGVRQAAVETLGKLEPAALAQHEQALAKAAKEDKDSDVRRAADKVLAELRVHLMQQLIDAGNVDAVVAKLEDTNEKVRKAAVETLGKLEAAAVAPLLPKNACYVSAFGTLGLPDTLTLQGKVYYEVTLLRTGPGPQIGWASPGFAPDDGNGVGDDALSWGADGVRHRLWHDGKQPWSGEWTDGDVIGCAADLEVGQLWFGRNGEWSVAFEGCGSKWTAGLFPAMSGNTMGVTIQPTPRFAGPTPEFRSVGRFPPQMLDSAYTGTVLLGEAHSE